MNAGHQSPAGAQSPGHRALARLRLPLIVAPMYSVSTPALVSAGCDAGVGAAFPATSARQLDDLHAWMAAMPATGFWGVSIVCHKTNRRLHDELDAVRLFRPPFVLAALGSPIGLRECVQAYGGLVFADVATVGHARQASENCVDALVLLCAGGGGHAGSLSPFAFVDEVRRFWQGPLVLAGGIGSGRMLRAALALGVDACCMGTRFIAAEEAGASASYREALLRAHADDIQLDARPSGVAANFLRSSLAPLQEHWGRLAQDQPPKPDFYREVGERRLWFDIHSAGHGVGEVRRAAPLARLLEQVEAEFRGS